MISSHLKNVFWPHIFVGASFQILDNPQVACGLRPTDRIRSDGESSYAGKLGPAAILNQNPIFEMASGLALTKKLILGTGVLYPN